MKWENKGKEFKKIGQCFEKVKRIYIYGAAGLGVQMAKSLSISDVEVKFVDADVNKQRDGVCGIDVVAPSKLIDENKKESLVILALPKTAEAIVTKKLVLYGFSIGENLFDIHVFRELYFPVFLSYHDEITYLNIVDISLTQICNLRCKDCSILTPYIDKPKHRELEKVLKDIDVLFEVVDYVENLYLIGGEPLMYPYIYQVCEYIGKTYRHKMHNFAIATNGLILMHDDLIEMARKHNISFQVSDYSKFLTACKEKVGKFVAQLEASGVEYLRMVDMDWCDYGFHTKKELEVGSEELINFFNDCAIDCKGIEDGQLYYCFPAMMVQKVLGEAYQDKGFDLSQMNEERKREILEFSLGYSDKGYLEVCRRCNGCYRVNKTIIPVAEQL